MLLASIQDVSYRRSHVQIDLCKCVDVMAQQLYHPIRALKAFDVEVVERAMAVEVHGFIKL